MKATPAGVGPRAARHVIIDAVSTWDDTSESVDYSVEDDNQLQPEDTLIDRGVDDILDEGISPPERPYAKTVLDHPGREPSTSCWPRRSPTRCRG